MAQFTVQITVETNASETWNDLAKSQVVRAVTTYCENSGWECVVNTADTHVASTEDENSIDASNYENENETLLAWWHKQQIPELNSGLDSGEVSDREEDSRESAS